MIQFDLRIFFQMGWNYKLAPVVVGDLPPYLHGGDLVLGNLHPPPEKSSWGVHGSLRNQQKRRGVDSVYQGSFGSPNHQFWDPMILMEFVNEMFFTSVNLINSSPPTTHDIVLMVQKSGDHQLRLGLVVHPIIYKAFALWDFFHQQ